jgi:hypothetical protein
VIEAEIRVESLLQTVCDQSFGISVGDPDVGTVYGAGLLFPCADAAPIARLSDVTVWEDGYNADPSFAEKAFDPKDAWHAYRMEMRDDRVRLIADGDDVVSGTMPTPLDPAATGIEAGIWTQGVDVAVRRVTISALPPD